MKIVELTFGRMHLLEKDLGELIVDEGVEVNARMIRELQVALTLNLEAPYRLLSNKRNNYSLNFEAQRQMSQIQQLLGIAVVVYSRAGELSTRVIQSVSKLSADNYRIFSCRQMAIQWLSSRSQQSVKAA